MVEENRAQWGRQIEFILTMVGYAVGLGNVWRFPYLCFQNGGGAFLIPYIICLVCLGIPMFALECSFGQFGGKGPVSIWSINPAMKGLGISMVATSAFVFIYYDVIIAWGLRFLVASFTTDLPWSKCDSCSCLLYNTNMTQAEVDDLKFNNSLGIPCPDLSLSDDAKSPSELYYYDEILRDTGTVTELGDVLWQILLTNAAGYTIVFLVLYRGIQSLGKVVYFTATFPYILLTILLIRSAMLEGASDGIEFYLKPDWSKLTDAKVWSDAAVQIFFSLSACMGGLIAMSSYNKFDNNIFRDALMIPAINCLTSFYAGFVVFSTLGHMAHIKNLPVANVTQGGPGLVFVVYPEALTSMPVSTLWSILFFIMLCILGFSTQFSNAETIMTSVIDEFPDFFRGYPSRNVLFRISVCAVGFICGIPMVTQGGSHLLNLIDEATLGYPMLFIGLFEYIVISYIYGYNNFAEDMVAMLGRKPFFYFKATWVVISPVMLTAVIIFKAYQGTEFEQPWVGLLYYLTVVFILIWIPFVYFYYTCRKGVWQMMRPRQEWRDRRKLGESPTEGMENGGSGFMSTLEPSKKFAEYTMHIKYDQAVYPKTEAGGVDNPTFDAGDSKETDGATKF